MLHELRREEPLLEVRFFRSVPFAGASTIAVCVFAAIGGRQVGMTLGVAVVGAVSGAGIAAAIGEGFAATTHTGWWITAALGFVVLVLGLLTTTEWADETARATARQLREGRSRYGPEELPVV